jgi:UDP-3-O-[3-hydroxymyristoyl] glucosamine N-acyltransferase
MADKNFFYKKADAVPLKELVFDLEHEIVCENGDVSQFMVKDAAPLARATKDEISFFSNIKYKEDLKNTSAGVIILEEENLPLAPENSIKILSSTPYLLYAKIVARLYPNEKFNHQIANSAIIDASAKIGENCYIGHGAII